MIRRHQRQACARQFHLHDFNLSFVIDVVEVQHWKDAGIRSPSPKVGAQIDALELFVERGCRESFHPLVEITEDDLRASNPAIVHDGLEASGLMASLEKRRAEVDVVQVHQVVAKCHVDALASAWLAGFPREVVVRVVNDRVAAQDDVAEQAAAEMSRGRHDPAHAEQCPELFRMTL